MIILSAPQTKEEFKAYYALRYRILREPLGQAHGTEKDDYEPISQHLMAKDDASGEIVGVVKWLEREPGVAWLTHLAVDIDYQKQGIGRLLEQAVEEAARAQGYRRLGALTRLDANDFFIKQGFRILDLPSPHFGGMHSVWMEKEL
jgi:N-acetylglutamate synthase-like GNAT family acetyltransferase